MLASARKDHSIPLSVGYCNENHLTYKNCFCGTIYHVALYNMYFLFSMYMRILRTFEKKYLFLLFSEITNVILFIEIQG